MSFVRLPRLLLYTTWFALVAGLTESLLLAVQRDVLHRIIYRSPDFWWLPAAGAFLLFAAVVLIVWLAGAVIHSLRRPRSLVAVLLFLSLFSVVMVGRWISPLSALLLTLGLTVGLIRSPRALPLVESAARRTTAPLAGLWLVLLLIGRAGPPLVEHRRMAGLPPAPDGAPNVIMLILDTVRARSLGLYGYARNTTPNLDQLAATGVTFDRAIAAAPWTLPSHASMFTGRQPFELSLGRFKALDDEYPTLAEVLRARGYATAGFVANLAYGTREFGLARGFEHWDDYQLSLSQILTNCSLGRFLLLERYAGDRNTWPLRVLGIDQWLGHTRSAADVNTDMLAWLARQPKRPFFVFVNYFDAHMPYLPPTPFRGRFGPVRERSLRQRLDEEGPGKWPKRGIPSREAAMRNRYEESIAYLDSQLGVLMAELRRRDLLDNTIVVVTSDHGEEFGRSGHYEHDSWLGFGQTHVPLVIVAPGRIPRGVRVEQPVALRDLGATVLQLSGVTSQALAGEPLFSPSGWPRPTDDHVLSFLDKHDKSLAALVTPQFHYIRGKTDLERLYDYTIDPLEERDLSQTPEGAAVLPGLRARLSRDLGDHHLVMDR